MPKIFDSLSKNLANESEKHFKYLHLGVEITSFDSTLEENTLSDITFQKFTGFAIRKINSNAFNKTQSKLTQFDCSTCLLDNEPPKHNIQTLLSQLTELTSLQISFYVSKVFHTIPTKWIQPIKGQESNLTSISIRSIRGYEKGLTIESGAFQNLNRLEYIEFKFTTFDRIENGSFKFNANSNKKLYITFSLSDLNGGTFNEGSFDQIKRPVNIVFDSTGINYLNESAFKSVLNNESNYIIFKSVDIDSFPKARIDCEDCKNYWLIKNGKEKQVIKAFCMHDPKMTLFDQNIKTKLNQKCK